MVGESRGLVSTVEATTRGMRERVVCADKPRIEVKRDGEFFDWKVRLSARSVRQHTFAQGALVEGVGRTVGVLPRTGERRRVFVEEPPHSGSEGIGAQLRWKTMVTLRMDFCGRNKDHKAHTFRPFLSGSSIRCPGTYRDDQGVLREKAGGARASLFGGWF